MVVAPSISGAVVQTPGPPVMVMGAAAVPDERGCSVSFHTLPHARYTVSPGASVTLASLARVCQGPTVALVALADVPE